MERKIRTRFAPSPTGPLHIGGVRTALYAYLFAKQHHGDFLLRIEDTDQNRFVPGAEQYIIDSLNWCGIKTDEGVPVGGPYAPYRQSERKEMYKKYAEQLVQSGHAYYAFDSSEELEAARKTEEAKGSSFSYGSAMRMRMKNSLSLAADEVKRKMEARESCVIRLRVPENEEIKFTDLIRGEVTFSSSTVDDKVLLKSDGMPTYHLAHIVDDYLMQITHAIRGEEWLPSAPAHILIYRFLGWENAMPLYAHLPLLLKPDGNGKLSKRDGDRLGFPVFPLEWKDPSTGEISSGYREKGYYPEAFINMIALLGWNAGTEQELFSMDELIKKFSFEHVHKGGAKFDPEKAKWFNGQYLRKTDEADLVVRFREALRKEFHFEDNDRRMSNQYLALAVHLLKERVLFENEFIEKGHYLFVEPKEYDPQVIAKKWKPDFRSFFTEIAKVFSHKETITATEAESVFKEIATKYSLKPGEVLQLLRVFMSGQAAGVDLFPMIELLGTTEAASRLSKALEKVQ